MICDLLKNSTDIINPTENDVNVYKKINLGASEAEGGRRLHSRLDHDTANGVQTC
jgi:hypothetical protein